jgi:hypothetical protein
MFEIKCAYLPSVLFVSLGQPVGGRLQLPYLKGVAIVSDFLSAYTNISRKCGFRWFYWVGWASRLPSNDLPTQARRPRYIQKSKSKLHLVLVIVNEFTQNLTLRLPEKQTGTGNIRCQSQVVL